MKNLILIFSISFFLQSQLYAQLTVDYTKNNVLPSITNTGSIELSVSGGVAPYTYIWNNGEDKAIIGGLSVGSYTVTVTDKNNSTAIQSIEVNYQLEWTDIEDPITLSNGSLNRGLANVSWKGLYSNNSLGINEDGFIQYTISTTSQRNMMIGFSQTNINGTWPSIDYKIYIYGKNLRIYRKGTKLIENLNFFQINDVFKIAKEGTSIVFYKNGISFHQISNITSGIYHTDVSVYRGNFPFKIEASFGFDKVLPTITPSTKTYAELKDKLDGGYYLVTGGNLFFKYFEEYKDGNLEFHVYNENNDEVPITQADLSNEDVASGDKKYGSNRFKLNVSLLTNGKYYILEVINDKDETVKVKFFK